MATPEQPKEFDLDHSQISFQNSQGIEVQAKLVHLDRFQAVFEVFTPQTVLRLSEALSEFRIIFGDRLAYTGRAVVNGLLPTRGGVVAQANLEDGWQDVNGSIARPEISLGAEFQDFIRGTRQSFRILPQFKLLLADMQILLEDLRLWLEQVQLRVASEPTGSRRELERKIVNDLKRPVFPLLASLFEKFELLCSEIPPDSRAAHAYYAKRVLHPLVLCAPFMWRTFRKPLGYAGDYEMVNMMVRDPLEGATLFAKVLNTFFLDTPPVVAHRNRIDYLKSMLFKELARVAVERRRARIFNLGCGPAREIQDFIREQELADRASFSLLDFNEETLAYTGKALTEAIQESSRKTEVQMIKKSVNQVLKESSKPNSSLLSTQYDLVYCAGLYDYLSDAVCQQLTSTFYRMVAPGGLLVVTNVDKCNPSRNWMEYSVDWHLVYRDAPGLEQLAPKAADPDSFRVFTEPSGVNTVLEVRKPSNA